MITTKRLAFVSFPQIKIHPTVANHRPVDPHKVAHYEEDILKHGLLEPLVVWEKNPNELYLVGGFHRHGAITNIRNKNPGYFDSVDVRVVAGDPDEMRALNLKLNADRLDAKITDYFDTVLHLNNVNWPPQRVAEFLDKSAGWVEEILTYVPVMPAPVRQLLEAGKISWAKAKIACQAVLAAPPGQERAAAERVVQELTDPDAKAKNARPLTFRRAKSRLHGFVRTSPDARYTLAAEDLLALLAVLEGKGATDEVLARVRQALPGLLD
jgi:ParB-like chromosome segregation protein Spo0J